jgi:hypothetical protein
VQDAASFDDLVALIDEELRAQIAIGRLGDIDPATPAVHRVASLVAELPGAERLLAQVRRLLLGVAGALPVALLGSALLAGLPTETWPAFFVM